MYIISSITYRCIEEFGGSLIPFASPLSVSEMVGFEWNLLYSALDE